MRGIDTNVLVRFLTRDDAAQFRRVREFLETRFAEADPVLVNVIVLCETVWVLRSAYRISRREIAAALDRLLGASGLVIEDRDQVAAAVDAYRRGPGDFADYLLGERNRAAGCVSTATLDRRLKSASLFQLV
ncbi:MAG: PIN domain-containing protein [Thermoanaerobaculia bacterium]